MSVPTNAENKVIDCHRILPGRTGAIADNADGAYNVVAVDHISAESAAGNINVTRRDYRTTINPNDTMLPNSAIGDRARTYYVDSAKTNPYDSDSFIKTRNGWQNILGVAHEIDDPGNAKAIPVDTSGVVAIVTAGAETRTLAAPSFPGQMLEICMKTDGGDCVITCTTTVNMTGNNRITLDDPGECVTLIAKRNGANLRWSVLATDGATLTTV